MEPPIFDDTMEMASPFHGHDDFEIDLDVIEDQVSNQDKDMTVADEDIHTSNNADNQLGVDDTDMTDDVAERAMVDADGSYPEHVDQGYDETYEADMLEDDYDEDIDAPMPNEQDTDAPAEPEHLSNEVVGEHFESVDETRPAEENRDEAVVEETSKVEVDEHQENYADFDQQNDQDPERSGTDQSEALPEHTEVGVGSDHEIGQMKSQPVQLDGDDIDNIEIPKAGHEDHEANKAELHADGSHLQAEQKTEEEPAHGREQHGADPLLEKSLHCVKVYYQENELSLFPPREGDNSEMFFLGDENLAYQDFAKLFESFHGVLKDSIGENEILVVDVDSLNIQLSEVCDTRLDSDIDANHSQDSCHTSKVTLAQIVDVYLRLCHNDDIAAPEPLYLTLSTSLTIPAQISDLVLSANEGKGLSEIHPWDEYDDTVVASAENLEGHYHGDQDKGVSEEVSEEARPAHGDAHDHRESHEALEDAEHLHERAADEETGAEQQYADDGLAGNDGDGIELATASEEVEETEGQGQPGGDAQADLTQTEAPRGGVVNEEAYDSEAQKSESTTTISHLPTSNIADEQQIGETAGADHNDRAVHDHGESTQHASVDDHDESYQEDVTVVPEQHNGGEHYEGHANDAPAQNDPDTGNLMGEPSFTEYEQTGEDWAAGTLEGGDEDLVEFEDDVDGAPQTSSGDKGENTHPDASDSKPQGSPAPSDGLLGISEDLMRSPVKQVDAQEEGKVDPDAVPDDLDDLGFDDEDYGLEASNINAHDAEFSLSEAHDSESVPAKRNREEGEELELDENSTPDTKRRRSS